MNNKNDKKIINLETEAADYLESFVNDKDNWKFKKKIQVWLLKNAFDPSAIKKTVFPSFLEYLKGLKGISKDLDESSNWFGLKLIKFLINLIQGELN